MTDNSFPKISRRGLLVGASALAATGPRPARAVLNIDINQGNVQPMPIALPDFLTGGPTEGDIGRNVTAVITNNLQRSGLFAPINPAAFIEKISNSDSVPRFPDWRTINAQALVTGRITRQGDGRLKAEFRLWDVFAGQQLDGKQYFTTPDNWRRIAHIISDAIYERLTGEKGYFDSRIVFVDETGAKDRRVKRLAIMDQDGAAVRYLTRGDDLVLTPRFNPSTQEITYMSYGQGDPRVYLLNIETGQREIVGNFPGMTFAPRFSPDGQRVIMSLQQGGNANLFVMDLRSKQTTRLTDTPGDRHGALLLAGRLPHLLRKRPWRQPADLRDVCKWRGGTAHQLWRRPPLDAGLVAAWGLHRLHRSGARQLLDRHSQARRFRRARAHARLPQRRPDVRAEWARADVLP